MEAIVNGNTEQQMTYEELMARVKQLEAEQAAKPAGKRGELTFKVSVKGGVSVYGLNSRYPITLYGNQWARLIDALPRLTAFLEANKANLSVKDGKAELAELATA